MILHKPVLHSMIMFFMLKSKSVFSAISVQGNYAMVTVRGKSWLWEISGKNQMLFARLSSVTKNRM